MRPRVPAAMCAVLLSAVACSARTPVIDDTPPPTATPSPTKSKPSARAPVAVKVASVLDETLYVYDVKTDKLTEVARGDGLRHARFVNENTVSFLQGDRPAYLRQIDLRSRVTSDLFSVETGIGVYGWSPARDIVAYVTTDDDNYPHLHMRTLAGGGATLTAATLARALGREFVPDDQTRIEFSPDGELVLMVYTPADGEPSERSDEESQLQIRSLDGSLVHASPMRRDPTMGFWAPNGERVYYRTGGGALYWDRGKGETQGLFSRPNWFNPSVSRSGRTVAFDTGGARASARVRLMDLRRGTITTIFKRARYHPVFASSTVVWAQATRRCADCPGGGEAVAEVYAWDVKKRKETRIALRSLIDADVYYR